MQALYNAGSVQSIATIAYLGAQRRKASARAMFMIHRSSVGPSPAKATGLKSMAESIALDDRRTELILRDHLDLWGEAAGVHASNSAWIE